VSARLTNLPRLVARRLRALLYGEAIDREMNEEMRQHLELEAADLVRTQGLTPGEARRRAMIAFGGVTRHEEAHRDARGIGWLEHLLRDLRQAARGLRRSPGFTASGVLVLTLGIGATTAVFSAVNAVLRNPAHDDIAVLFFRGFPSLSAVDYLAIAEQQRTFSAVGAMRRDEAAFRADGEPERVRVGRTTSGFFRVIGVRPLAGRLLEPGDESPGADRVAVVSHALAVRALGGPVAAVGRSVMVDGIAHTVIGVLPEPADALLADRADVWPALQLEPPTRRGPFGILVVARLAPGATFESATRDVAGISERIFPLWAPAWSDRSARFEALPIRSAALGEQSRMLRIFGLAVALVLLIGVANVASLMLVRAIGRAREVSLRSVLGASRWQLVRLFAAESALLSLIGAAAGVGAAALGLRALIAFGPGMPGLSASSLDLRAVALAVVLALAAGLIVGSAPVAMLLRQGPIGLSSGERAIGGGRGARWARSGFVVAQFALALPLLAVSGLLLASFARLQRVDPGFDPANLLTVRVSLPAGQYADDAPIAAYWSRAIARLRDLPGVREVGLASSLPPDDFGTSNDNFNLIDRPAGPGMPEPNGPWPSASGDYFAALGVPLLEGRMFTPNDTGPGPVILVSRAWAAQYYPGESPLGKTMVRGGCTDCEPTTVIGVVDDVRYSGLAGSLEAMYSPLTEQWNRTLYMYVRTAGAPRPLVEPVREALRSVDPSVPLDDVASMEERMYTAVAEPRRWAALLTTFAAAALGLAAVGVFGMLSYLVGTRRREIGVRMALGARRATVVQMVLGSGVAHAIAGSVIGLAAALLGTRMVAPVLHGVAAGDPATLGLATAVLLGVAVVACWLPARRAARIAPMEAIRLD
jgi:putative ABC transport system permease protein